MDDGKMFMGACSVYPMLRLPLLKFRPSSISKNLGRITKIRLIAVVSLVSLLQTHVQRDEFSIERTQTPRIL